MATMRQLSEFWQISVIMLLTITCSKEPSLTPEQGNPFSTPTTTNIAETTPSQNIAKNPLDSSGNSPAPTIDLEGNNNIPAKNETGQSTDQPATDDEANGPPGATDPGPIEELGSCTQILFNGQEYTSSCQRNCLTYFGGDATFPDSSQFPGCIDGGKCCSIIRICQEEGLQDFPEIPALCNDILPLIRNRGNCTKFSTHSNGKTYNGECRPDCSTISGEGIELGGAGLNGCSAEMKCCDIIPACQADGWDDLSVPNPDYCSEIRSDGWTNDPSPPAPVNPPTDTHQDNGGGGNQPPEQCNTDKNNYCFFGPPAIRDYCDPNHDNDYSDGDWDRGYIEWHIENNCPGF